tara:strand:- start:169 stop:816 length:648 start_codon:yes stop_codon:yes gene_type:complete
MDNTLKYTFYYWGPFLFRTEIPENLIIELKNRGNKTKISHHKNLAGNLKKQNTYTDEDKKWFHQAYAPAFQSYLDGFKRYHDKEHVDITGFDLQSLWINNMKAGDYNPRHVHTGDLSFVIFLDVPKKLEKENEKFEGKSSGPGSITFSYGESNRPFWATSTRNIFPKTGEMYIFPALLNHYVHPFKTKNVTRISVSGNVNFNVNDKRDRARYDII